MMQVDLYMILISKMPRQCICRVYAPVLTPGTAKVHRQARKPSFDIILYRNIHDVIDPVEEFGHPGLLFQEILHRFIPTRQGLELCYPAGIEDAAAVEDKAASVTTLIFGYTFTVGKAMDMHHQWRLVIGLHRFEPPDHFILYHQIEQALEFRQDNAHLFMTEETFYIP